MSNITTITVTVAHDGTLTRAGAKVLREFGQPATGSTTLAQARAMARKMEAIPASSGARVKVEFVKATNTSAPAKAKRARKIAPVTSTTTSAKSWENHGAPCRSLREHISTGCKVRD